jgi:D-alanyl-lipoteichoic acid acyltransferase DltB (MBOAT superfamily)
VPFAIQHVVKVSSVVLTVMLLADCGARVWRRLGGAALDPMRLPALASTPAEFWRRWNRPVQQFLYEYPFQAAGGAKRPVRATLMAFIVSGLAHEYVFVIASGRLQAWQLLFFSLQGAAAIVTSRLQPRGWHALPCIAATIAFNLAAALLFFRSVNTVLPFYTARIH